MQPCAVKTARESRAGYNLEAQRAVKSDLMRFKALMEMREQPAGAWEGTIKEGQVVQKLAA